MNRIRPIPMVAGLVLLLGGCGRSQPPASSATPTPAITKEAPQAQLASQPATVVRSGPSLPAADDPGHYTSLEASACKVLSVDRETGGSTARCAGLRGYQLNLQDSDARMSIDVVAPDGKVTPLRLASLAGGGAFSSLGKRAEWRFDNDGKPSALIVRFDAYEKPEHPDRPVSYLVVARLTGGEPCAIARIEPGEGQNLRARQMADAVAGKACLQNP